MPSTIQIGKFKFKFFGENVQHSPVELSLFLHGHNQTDVDIQNGSFSGVAVLCDVEAAYRIHSNCLSSQYDFYVTDAHTSCTFVINDSVSFKTCCAINMTNPACRFADIKVIGCKQIIVALLSDAARILNHGTVENHALVPLMKCKL